MHVRTFTSTADKQELAILRAAHDEVGGSRSIATDVSIDHKPDQKWRVASLQQIVTALAERRSNLEQQLGIGTGVSEKNQQAKPGADAVAQAIMNDLRSTQARVPLSVAAYPERATNKPPSDGVDYLWKAYASVVEEEANATRTLVSALASSTSDSKPDIMYGTRGNCPQQQQQQCRITPGTETVTIAQYNILASYLGKNTMPWFLYGITITPERRKAVFARYYSSDNPMGGANGYGWPWYAEGLLTPQEMKTIEDIDERVFNWDRRKNKLLRRIHKLDADILSLVEVDHHEDFFKGELGKLGYDSVFRKRPRSTSADGCGVYWKRNEFDLLANGSVDFVDRYPSGGAEHGGNRHHTSQALSAASAGSINAHGDNSHGDDDDDDDESTSEASARRTDRTCLCTLLRKKTGNRERMIVVSVHLARNPEDPEQDKLRGKQMAEMLFFITNFAQKHGVEDAPVVVCGDVNATNYNKLRGIASTAAVFGEAVVHPFIFEFLDVPSRATSITTMRRMRIDAILYQKTHLELADMDFLPMLSPRNPIPNEQHPSDHLAMKATFRFKSRMQRLRFAALEWWAVVSGTGFSLGAPLNHKELQHAFVIFDFTGTDNVDIYSLKQALQQLRIHCSEDVALALLAPTGGEMNYVQFCMRYLCDEQFVGDSDRNAAVHEAFNVVDANGDQQVSVEEFVRYFEIFRDTPLQVSEDDLAEIFCVTGPTTTPISAPTETDTTPITSPPYSVTHSIVGSSDMPVPVTEYVGSVVPSTASAVETNIDSGSEVSTTDSDMNKQQQAAKRQMEQQPWRRQKLSYAKFCFIFMIKYTRLFFPPLVAGPVVTELKAQFDMRQHGDLFCWDESPNLRKASSSVVDDTDDAMAMAPCTSHLGDERED